MKKIIIIFLLFANLIYSQQSHFYTIAIKNGNNYPDALVDGSSTCSAMNIHSDTLQIGDSISIYQECVFVTSSGIDTVSGNFYLKLDSGMCTPYFLAGTFTLCNYQQLKTKFIKNLGAGSIHKNVYMFKTKLSFYQTLNKLCKLTLGYNSGGNFDNNGVMVYIKSNPTGINEISANDPVLFTNYFNLIGQSIEKPRELCIEVVTHRSGAVEKRKVFKLNEY